MKTIGVLLIIVAIIIGYVSDHYINPLWSESFIGMAFCFFLLGIYALILNNNCPKTTRDLKMINPPVPPKECICNDISKHSPGGRCEAEHN